MNSQAILFLLAQLAGTSSGLEVCRFSLKEIALPISESRVLVVDGNGKELPPSKPRRKLEFSHLIVRVPIIPDTAETYWIPKDMDQAAVALKVMLPMDFYTRLLKGYGGVERKWTAVEDPGISERWDDLVSFLDTIWGSGWSNEKNSYDQVRYLINYSVHTNIRIPNDCGARRDGYGAR